MLLLSLLQLGFGAPFPFPFSVLDLVKAAEVVVVAIVTPRPDFLRFLDLIGQRFRYVLNVDVFVGAATDKF